ncbi:hypothetical protein D3C74_272990 [compost metagenome]
MVNGRSGAERLASDRKFYIKDQAGAQAAAERIAGNTLHRKQQEYVAIQRINGLYFPMSQVVYFGICDVGKDSEQCVYMLLTWGDGIPLEEHQPGLSPEEQYRLGAESGRILKQMHAFLVTEELPRWEADMQYRIIRMKSSRKS